MIFENTKNFFEVVYEGGVSMYIYHRIELSNKTDNTGGYGSQDLHGQAFRPHARYVFLNEAGQGIEVKLTKKSLLEVMSDHAAEVEKYIKSNKLKVKEQADLVKVLYYYDSL
jgi:hypothetical protein